MMMMTRKSIVVLTLCCSQTYSFVPTPRTFLPCVKCSAVEKTNNPFETVQDEGDAVSINNVNQQQQQQQQQQRFDLDDLNTNIEATDDQIDAILDKALNEAVSTVSESLPDEIVSVLDPAQLVEDESFRKEVEDIFDRATLDLKATLNDIRKDQDEFVKASAEQSLLKTEARLKEENARLEAAESNMSVILDRVNKEAQEVEKAVQELREVQEQLGDSDPLLRLANGGIIRQAALASTLLFSVRALLETVAMVGPDGSSHATAALIQGAIALVSAAYFFFA